jgi:predicted nucleotidyltransferase component of viral defense system
MQEMSLSDHYEKLYKLQDQLLKALESLSSDFYLTGGTALSRCFLNHRYSDDLDFFIHNEEAFIEKVSHIVSAFRGLPCNVEVERLHESFSRVMVTEGEKSMGSLILKIDFVNEKHLPHFGPLVPCSFFSRVDNMRNILSNKVCALARLEAKDVADIWGICRHLSFSWDEIIEEANQKAVLEELMIVDLLRTFPAQFLSTIKWAIPIETSDFERAREAIIEDIITKRGNSLYYERQADA